MSRDDGGVFLWGGQSGHLCEALTGWEEDLGPRRATLKNVIETPCECEPFEDLGTLSPFAGLSKQWSAHLAAQCPPLSAPCLAAPEAQGPSEV